MSSGSRRVGRLLVAVGGIGVVAALVFLVTSVVALVREVDALRGAPVAAPAQIMTVDLDAGESRTLWATARTPYDATCTLRHRDGAQPALHQGGGSTTIEIGGDRYEKVAEYTAVAAGTHQLACTGEFTVTGPEVGGATTIIRVVTGVFALIAALVPAILGAVLWQSGRDSRRDDGAWSHHHRDPGEGPVSTAYEPPGL